VAFCGHGGTGKTTLVDKLLALTGAVKGLHSVDDGTSVCDSYSRVWGVPGLVLAGNGGGVK